MGVRKNENIASIEDLERLRTATAGSTDAGPMIRAIENYQKVVDAVYTAALANPGTTDRNAKREQKKAEETADVIYSTINAFCNKLTKNSSAKGDSTDAEKIRGLITKLQTSVQNKNDKLHPPEEEQSKKAVLK